MDDKLFSDLVSSVKEGGKILRGKKKASRTFERADDVRAVREQTHLSQADFATLIGVNLKTLQNWEQGRRKPQGPARQLLKIVAANPKSAVRALHA